MLYKPNSSGPLTAFRGHQFKSVKYDFWTFSYHPANNTILLTNGIIVIVKNIVQGDNEIRIIGRKFLSNTYLYVNSGVFQEFLDNVIERFVQGWSLSVFYAAHRLQKCQAYRRCDSGARKGERKTVVYLKIACCGRPVQEMVVASLSRAGLVVGFISPRWRLL